MGYKKSNENQFGRVLPFAFALIIKCNRIYLLFSSLSDFDSFRCHLMDPHLDHVMMKFILKLALGKHKRLMSIW